MTQPAQSSASQKLHAQQTQDCKEPPFTAVMLRLVRASQNGRSYMRALEPVERWAAMGLEANGS